MKSKIQIGDRVSLQCYFLGEVLIVKGIYLFDDPDSMVAVKTDTGKIYRGMPRSMRKLVKKKRQELWVNFYQNGTSVIAHAFETEEFANTAAGHEFYGKRFKCVRYIKAKDQS